MSRAYSDINHRRDIDGLRALAALSVVASHTVPRIVLGGGAGVDMFFVLSGFLISGIILRALVRDEFSFATFYARRIRRIFPALIVVLVTVWALGGVLLLPDEYRRLGKDIASAATFTLYIFWGLETNLSFDIDLGGNFLTQLWSLGVEEQFYLVWPLFVLLIYKFSKSKLSHVAVGVTAAAVASFGLSAVSDRLWLGFALVPWRCLYELCLGGLLSVVQIGAFPTLRRLVDRVKRNPLVGAWVCNANILSLVGAALLIYSILNDPATELFSNSWTLPPAVGTLLLLSSGSQSFVGRRLFGSAGMVFFGLISYPLYLWHFPLLFLFFALTWGHTPSPGQMLVLVLSTAAVLAFLTYKYLEIPIRVSPMRTRTVAILCSAMILCGLIGIVTFYGGVHPVSYFMRGDLALPASEDWFRAFGGNSWTQFQEKPLVLGDGEPDVLFMGDSNMQQYYPRIQKLFSDGKTPPHRAAVFITRFGCVPGAGMTLGQDEPDLSGCRRYMQEAIGYAERPNIDSVVIAGCWYGSFSEWSYYFDHGDRSPLNPSTDSELKGLKRMIDSLVRSGKRIYLVLNIPVGKGLDPRARAYWYGETPLSLKKSEVTATLEPIDSKLRTIADEAGASVIDPLEFLCETTQCPVVGNDGKSMYHDMWHLRPSYVRDKVMFLDKILYTH